MTRGELIVLCGPTASGKSACALEICRRTGGKLVSCDSMQLYRGMDIGTAKPSAAERAEIEHFMIDVLDPCEKCTAARYRELVLPVIDRLISDGVQPVLCGGTGLYINALTKPLGFAIEGDPALRAALEERAERDGGRAQLHGELLKIDAKAASRLHENDVRRVVRALEVYYLTGRTLSEQMRLDAEGGSADCDAKLFALDWPRDVLYTRIDLRVDEMIEQGLVREVERLLDSGLRLATTATQAIGYKEIAEALRGDVTLSEAIDRIKQNSRRYAKRQLTWFRRDGRVHWIQADDRSISGIADEIMEGIML